MAEAPRLAAALRYQQELDDPTRPATVNPMMARQVAKSRELMTAPTSIMDERYPAWKKAQEDADLFLLGADAAGLAPFAAKGATVAAKFAAPKLAQGLEQHMIRSGMILPIDVYHGSPHRFAPTAKNPLGEFDPTKIGTGEGAQAYGYGHYTAEAKDIGKRYREALAHKGALDLEYETNKRGIPLSRDARIEFKRQAASNVPAEKIVRNLQNANIEARNLDQTKLAELVKDYKESKQGTLYKVNLSDEAIPRMLDWDKPLSPMGNLQIKPVAKNYNGTFGTGEYGGYAWHLGDAQLSQAFRTPEKAQQYAPLGREIIKELNAITATPTGHSELLSKAGIPGIQYLDAGSRGAGTGTRNFVVFPGNENLLNILGRE